ncbi:hypothetical protein [Niastella yeongjuensis]|nr:hypothetical protein [Niastella yeongjuensis]
MKKKAHLFDPDNTMLLEQAGGVVVENYYFGVLLLVPCNYPHTING